MYDSSLKYKWDNKNILDYARQEGIELGIEKGIEKGKMEEAREIARELKREGLPFDFIAKTTKLSVEEIEKL
jgi:predicted transposase/invertase (TIGR01784 family)